jgi:DNA mismatch repair protein MutL
MPSRIRILSEALANRIAAGEVVEGPHSVVKELVENSIDAGADAISIDIKGAGSDLIRVADNGVGMNSDDALAAFDRFATSKISGEHDLETIETLGFRGEALPSISSVSRVRLVTCEPRSSEGTEVSLLGGTVKDVRPAGRSHGTTMEISSLFFNTPARRKFLKSNRVELRKILDSVTEYAILYPHIRFDLTVDGRSVLALLPAPGILERALEVLGSARAGEAFHVVHTDGPYTVGGLVGKPSIARARGAFQLLAVNGRPVKSRLLSAAVRAGYGELLPRNRHPIFALVINVDSRFVDANVHPTKREVRFSEERRVFALAENAVRNTLMEHDIAPTLTVGVGDTPPESGSRTSGMSRAATGVGSYESGRRNGEIPATRLPFRTGELSFPSAVREPARTLKEGYDIRQRTGEAGHITSLETGEQVKFWQLHRTYIFVQTREGVLIVDQHAAHERVIYEQVRRRLSGAVEAGPSQQLLFPIAVELSPAESDSFKSVDSLLTRLGFSVRPMSGRTVLMEAVPGAFPKLAHDRILHDLLAEMPSGKRADRDIIESIATTMACKTAIKAGDALAQEEMRALLDQLFATELPYSCPHGRPTFMRMTLDELHKRFGRT